MWWSYGSLVQLLLFSMFTTFTALVYFLCPLELIHTVSPLAIHRINECQADQVCDVKLLLNAMSFLFSKDKLCSVDPEASNVTQFTLFATAHLESATGVRFTFPHPVKQKLCTKYAGWLKYFYSHVLQSDCVVPDGWHLCIYIHIW